MIRFPALDTVSFDSTLPLCFLPAPSAMQMATAQLETRLALAVLAMPAEDDSSASPAQQRLEAKLDYILALGLLARHAPLANNMRCRIGLDEVCWLDNQTQQGEGLLQLQPQSPSTCMLYLPVHIQRSEATDGQWLHRARLQAFHDEREHRHWERWVFRQHRLRIGHPAV